MNKEKFVLHSFNKYCDNLLNEGLLPKSLAHRIFRNIDPTEEFPKSIHEFINLILRVVKDKENWDDGYTYLEVDYEAWYYFLTGDKEVLERSFFKITNPNHLPKISKNKNSIYYDILPEKKVYSLRQFYTMSDENTKKLVDVAKAIRKPATSSQISDLCGFPSDGLDSTFMGNYTISYGKDYEGEYISYYDVWDFTSSKLPILGNIMDFVGYPFEIYGRIYFDVIDEKRARFRPAIQI